MTIATILAESELDGVEITPVNADELNVQGTTEESWHRWLPIVEENAREIIEHIQQCRSHTAADAVRVAERIIATSPRPKRARRKRVAQ